jgi:hypothetical protein
MREEPQDNKSNKPATRFNPLSWGILFFSFWVLLQTIPESTACIQGWSWFFLGMSVLLWFSIFVKKLRDFLNRPGPSRYFLPLVFFVSLFAFAVSLSQSWVVLKEIPLYISVVGGILWFVAYLLILVRLAVERAGRTIGIVVSLGIVLVGIRLLITPDILAGIVLIALGGIATVIAIRRPTFGYSSLVDLV